MLDTTFSVIEIEEQRNELAAFYSKYKEQFCWIVNSKARREKYACC